MDVQEAVRTLSEGLEEDRSRKRENGWSHPEPIKTWEEHGLTCMVLRGPLSVNGYVKVPEGHPWHKVHYSECPDDCGEDWCSHSPEALIDVHGGITFSHLAEDGGWWFGFDTAHLGDAVSGMPGLGGVARGARYVEDQTQKMAEQLAAVGDDA